MDSCLARRVQNVAHRRVRHSEFYNRCATSSSYHSRLHESDPDVFLRGLWTGRKFHQPEIRRRDRKSTRLNSSHVAISYAVFCLKKKKELDSGVSNSKTTMSKGYWDFQRQI